MTSKRYVLLEAEEDVTPQERRDFVHILERRFGKLKAIPVEGNDRVLLVRTDNVTAPRLRGESPRMKIGDKRVVSILTSGSIGKLKRRAKESAARGLGEVLQ